MRKVNIIWPAIHTTENMAKGLAFERWVVDRFDPAFFDLLQWQSDKYAAGIFPSPNRDPDLVYRFTQDAKSTYFALECKWRQEEMNDTIHWTNKAQLERYHQFRQKTGLKLFIMLGLGGYPSSPASLYIVPFDEISDRLDVPIASLRKHERNDLNAGFFLDTEKGILI